jgi:hypothetical protein
VITTEVIAPGGLSWMEDKGGDKQDTRNSTTKSHGVSLSRTDFVCHRSATRYRIHLKVAYLQGRGAHRRAVAADALRPVHGGLHRFASGTLHPEPTSSWDPGR